MEKGVYVKDIRENTPLSGVYVVTEAIQSRSRNGPFWKLSLSDKSGIIEAKIWHPLSAEFNRITAGVLARVSGRASRFRDQLQITVEAFAPLSAEETAEASLGDYVPASERDPEEMFRELRYLCHEEFKYPPWRKFVSAVLNNPDLAAKLKSAPGAKSVHHAYAGGLLEHTLSVFKLCETIADHYADLDRQTLLAGALFHDFGKIFEYSGGFDNDYTNPGRLLGHVFLGLEALTPFLAKSGLDDFLAEHLKHLILSHHGEPEFGAAKIPQTAEAFALHYADNLDAKIAQLRSVFADMTPGEWTPFQKTLGRAVYFPERTPEDKNERKNNRSEAACLSLLRE